MNRSIKEKTLLLKIRSTKDTDAFAALYDMYVEPIYRFVYFKISNKEEAEDVTSDVFLRAWDYLGKTDREIGSFRSLVYTIARNCVIDVYRQRAKRQECSIEVAASLSSGVELEADMATDEAVRELMDAIRKLKQEYQDVIHLRHIEGLTVAEIADVMDKSRTNVRVTLHRAIKKLKEFTGDAPAV